MAKFSWLRAVATLLLLCSFNVIADSKGMLSELTDELDISYNEAKGGVGAIFEYAKDTLDRDDFDRISKGIPDMDDLLDAAPRVDRDSGFGRVSDALGDFGGGGRAHLAGSFEELDLDPEMVHDFLPVVYDYVDSVSGERAREYLEDLFPGDF